MVRVCHLRWKRVDILHRDSVIVDVQHDEGQPDGDTGLVRGGPNIAVIRPATTELRSGPRHLVLALTGIVVLDLLLWCRNLFQTLLFISTFIRPAVQTFELLATLESSRFPSSWHSRGQPGGLGTNCRTLFLNPCRLSRGRCHSKVGTCWAARSPVRRSSKDGRLALLKAYFLHLCLLWLQIIAQPKSIGSLY